MAAQPTPSQTRRNTTPTPCHTLTAAQARGLLQTLLSTVPNPTSAQTRALFQTILSTVPNITADQAHAHLHFLLSPAANPTAVQVRIVLQTLLSTATNPTAPRTAPNNTTLNNAPNPSSPPSKNQLPSSLPTITIDASTRIIGHGNKIRLPPKNVNKGNNINEAMRAVLAKPVNLTIKTGITLSGNRNTVYFESGSDIDHGAASKDLVKARAGMKMVVAERACEEGATGRKRRAVSEPVGEARGKKVKVMKEF